MTNGKTAAEKMRMGPGMSVCLLHAPEEADAFLGMPEGTTRVAHASDAQFVLVFARTQAEAEERLAALAPTIDRDTLAWLAYPKGAGRAGHDVSRDTIWRFAETLGLRLVAQVALDETWSAVRIRPAA